MIIIADKDSIRDTLNYLPPDLQSFRPSVIQSSRPSTIVFFNINEIGRWAADYAVHVFDARLMCYDFDEGERKIIVFDDTLIRRSRLWLTAAFAGKSLVLRYATDAFNGRGDCYAILSPTRPSIIQSFSHPIIQPFNHPDLQSLYSSTLTRSADGPQITLFTSSTRG